MQKGATEFNHPFTANPNHVRNKTYAGMPLIVFGHLGQGGGGGDAGDGVCVCVFVNFTTRPP